MPPERIGHYRISSKLGQGGMGEVYLATDTKLNREVALKILPDSFAQNRERIARLVREAQVLAALNHPSIAAIYGLEDAGATKALILEMVDGETLAERIHRGPLTLAETLEVGKQIADALEAAHEKGIIHRDLKPANVKVTTQGKVKVLDFGLAKLVEGSTPASSPTDHDSPTLQSDDTQGGVILGTAAYMSPEQAKGKAVDKRSDIWSFGCVLFECLTGQRIFSGETVADSMAALLHKEPDWNLLPSGTPAPVELLLRKCLVKDRQHRLHDIADARVDLEQAVAGPTRSQNAASVEGSGGSKGSRWMTAALWSWAFISWAVILLMIFWPKTAPLETRVQSYTLNLAPDTPLATAMPLGSSVILSPDGSKVVYFGQKDGIMQLYWRQIDRSDFQPVPGAAKTMPPAVFSPQSDRMAFWTDNGEMKVYSFDGGMPRRIGSGGQGVCLGGHWGPENRIVYSVAEGIYTISAKEGAAPKLVLAREKNTEDYLLHPQFLPEAKAILFTVVYTNAIVSLQAFDLESRYRKRLDLAASPNPIYYAPTGHLVYGRDDVMFARSFDSHKLEFTGPEISLLTDLGRDWGSSSHQFTLAENGTLIYGRGRQSQPQYQLVCADSRGKEEPLPLQPSYYSWPRLAPNGRSVVVRGASNKQLLVTLPGGVPVELGIGNESDFAFAYDGTYIYLSRRRGGSNLVTRMRPDATQDQEEIYRIGSEDTWAIDISSDGRYLILIAQGSGQGDILIKDLRSSEKPLSFLTTPANETGARFSPDGHWVAYSANTTDRYEVYAKRFPDGGLPIQVSEKGGSNPVWSQDGTKLYYRNASRLMVAKVKAADPILFEAPTVFAAGRFISSGINGPANFDVLVGSDGERLLLIKSIEDEPEPQFASQLRVVVHFDNILRRGQKLEAPGRF